MEIRIVLCFILLVILGNCGKPFVGEGLVIFLRGDVKLSSGKGLEAESKIYSNQTILLGAESLADIQFSYSDQLSSVAVRLEDNSRFQFRETEPKKNQNLSFQLYTGSGNFRITQPKDNLIFTIETPVAGFFAPKGDFQITVEPNGDTTFRSLMGNAKGYRRISDEYFTNVPDSLLSEVSDIKDTIEAWKKDLNEIKTGETVTIRMADNEDRLRKAGLLAILEKAKQTFSNAPSEQTNPEKVKEFVAFAKKEYESNASARQYISSTMKEELPFKVEKLSVNDLKKRLKEVESLTYIDPQKIAEAKNLRELIQKRNDEIKSSLMQTVATVKSGNVGKVKTPDGRELDCVVYTDFSDPDYVFCDPVTGKEEKFHKKSIKLRFTD